MNDIDRQTIRNLSSAQPEKRTEERTKTHASDCIRGETHACDCISRQAAKKIIFDEFEGWPTDEEVAQLKRLTKQFDELSSVTPERKTEKWIWNKRTGEYECSECGCNPIYERTTPDVSEIDKYRYCRWCGAPMEVEG